MIRAQHVSKSFGGIRAVADCSLTVDGVDYVEEHAPAQTILTKLLAKKLKSSKLCIEGSQDWPALLPHFYCEAARAGFGPQDLEVTTARTTATCDVAGSPVRQLVVKSSTLVYGSS